jgi:hypothetical protein
VTGAVPALQRGPGAKRTTVFHAFRKQRALHAISFLNEALHPSPAAESLLQNRMKSAFTHGERDNKSAAAEEVAC